MSDKNSTHTSYHGSGFTNHDYSGKSGTSHVHEREDKDGNKIIVEKWETSEGKTLTKDSDGVWRDEDGSVYRGDK
ncbi:hypothetical protein [Youngiibacter multivorans]|uniref:Uncharacterized protein n=1 Tax=Youngiibacter multivorans TaxID=937251 RepID=A0ABS4G0I7_9CLOT|nr:hypothetical protein [Youngiibacter multivorans]MBP1917840.1 hypothetical protein [Youngiibacter multivorans]